ncbi:MAG TPA: amidohydrolase family protein [Blastocatellia bacterium]
MLTSKTIFIRNVRLLDGTSGPPILNASVLIERGRVAKVDRGEIEPPASALILDGSGKTVMPGLIDMHAHLLSGGFDTLTEHIDSYDFAVEKRALAQMLYWGVTTVYNPVQPLETVRQLREFVKENPGRAPRIFLSGPGFTSPGGWAGSLLPIARIEPQDEATAEREVNRLADASVDILKIYYDAQCCAFVSPLPRLARPVMERIIETAHRRGLKVMVHAYDIENHKDALRAGADIMAHSAVTAAVDEEYIALARDHKSLYLATLSVYNDAFDEDSLRSFIAQTFVRESVARPTLHSLGEQGPLGGFLKSVKHEYLKNQLPTIKKNLATVFESGVPIGVGPDTGVMGAFPGISVHREMELMVEAGVPAHAVLSAASSAVARYLRLENDVGTVAEGKTADLVILDGNPLDDIRNTRRIAAVIKEGLLVNRDSLRSEFLSYS